MSSKSNNENSGIRSGKNADNVIRVFGAHAKSEGGLRPTLSGREADRAEAKQAGEPEAETAAVEAEDKPVSPAPEKSEPKKAKKVKKAKAEKKEKPKKVYKPKTEEERKNIRGAVIAVLLIILIGAACFGIYKLSIVNAITVRGCGERYTTTQVINQAGLYTGKCILLYDTGDIAAKLREDPYIKVLSVKKVYPNRISIEIEERSEYAAIVTGTGTFCIIDREGCILYTGRRDMVEGLLPVYGMGTIGFKTGNYVNADKSKLRPYVLMELIESIGDRDYEIASIDLSVPASLKIETLDGYTVMLGDSVDIENKVERMFAALEKARQTSPDSRYIYINDSGSADISSGAPAPPAAPTAAPTAAATPDPEAEATSGFDG